MRLHLGVLVVILAALDLAAGAITYASPPPTWGTPVCIHVDILDVYVANTDGELVIYNTVTGLSDVKTFTGVTSFRHCVKGNTRFIYLLDDGTNSEIIQYDMVAGAETSRYSSSYKHMVLGWNSGTEYLFSVNSRSDVNWIVFQLNDDTDTVSTYDDAGTLQNKFDDNLFYAVECDPNNGRCFYPGNPRTDCAVVTDSAERNDIGTGNGELDFRSSTSDPSIQRAWFANQRDPARIMCIDMDDESKCASFALDSADGPINDILYTAADSAIFVALPDGLAIRKYDWDNAGNDGAYTEVGDRSLSFAPVMMGRTAAGDVYIAGEDALASFPAGENFGPTTPAPSTTTTTAPPTTTTTTTTTTTAPPGTVTTAGPGGNDDGNGENEGIDGVLSDPTGSATGIIIIAVVGGLLCCCLVAIGCCCCIKKRDKKAPVDNRETIDVESLMDPMSLDDFATPVAVNDSYIATSVGPGDADPRPKPKPSRKPKPTNPVFDSGVSSQPSIDDMMALAQAGSLSAAELRKFTVESMKDGSVIGNAADGDGAVTAYYTEPAPPIPDTFRYPVILDVCTEWMMNRGLNEEGVFRVPSSKTKSEELLEEFKNGSRGDIADMHDPCEVAGLIKYWTKSVKGTMFPTGLEKKLALAQAIPMSMRTERVEAMRDLLAFLSEDQFVAIERIVCMFSMIAANSKVNKMTAKNLGMTFAPTLFNKISVGPASAVLCFWIENYTAIFDEDDGRYE